MRTRVDISGKSSQGRSGCPSTEEAAIPGITATDADFVFVPMPPIAEALETSDDPLGPLAPLVGSWRGTGFNTIWRPHYPKDESDRFLELNLTNETFVFSPILGEIPNRGLLQPDIAMTGVTYMQQVSDATVPPPPGPGLHIEPGLWVWVPPTTEPAEPATVVRMASIPHGTVMLAQGTVTSVTGAPAISDVNVIPYPIGSPEPPGSDFPAAKAAFPELDLSVPTPYRLAPAGVTEDMVANPSGVLDAVLSTQRIRKTVTLSVTTDTTPVAGGGTANTAFLGVNANAVHVDAAFWIEYVEDPGGGPDTLQLQYRQKVLLDFDGMHFPHVSVATLQREG